MTCLLVSSCPLRAQLLAGVLGQCCGLPITCHCCGVEPALAMIERHAPRLVILDWDGGDDGCQRISRRLLERRAGARLILLSIDPRLDGLRQELGSALAFAGFWPSLQAAVASLEGLSGSASPRQPLPADSRFAALRPRERSVLELLGAGLVSREIAHALGLSLQTVETYRKNLSAKLGVSGARLVRVAVLYVCLHLGQAVIAKDLPSAAVELTGPAQPSDEGLIRRPVAAA